MMAHTRKASELGWFYHTANKQTVAEPVNLPPTSQIPGLSDLAPEPPQPDPSRGWIRDTDSNYVRLAKTGGRRDLLVFREPRPHPDKPKAYPRVDWFYLEDIAAEETEKRSSSQQNEPYQFLLPDYMVHHGPGGTSTQEATDSDSQQYVPKRAAFHFDNMSVFQRDGDSVGQKNVKLPDIQQNNAVRMKQKKPVKYLSQAKPERAKPPAQQMPANRKFYQPMPAEENEERPVMSKILSFGYAKEWEERRNHWDEQQRQQEAKDKNGQGQRSAEKPLSEYQYEMAKTSKLNSPRSHPNAGDSHSPKTHAARHFKQEEPKPEPFKLSRFKHVPARTNTHRTPHNITTGAT